MIFCGHSDFRKLNFNRPRMRLAQVAVVRDGAGKMENAYWWG
jgi:hypothetical protein